MLLHRTITGLAAVIVVSLPVLTGAPAQAKGGDDGVRRSGTCSGSTDWKIKAKADDGRIEVEAEIDSNHRGQTWRWVLRHDGRVAARGHSVTAGRSGSFEVERHVSNAPGSDSYRFRAVDVRSGEVCVARVAR
ncbi:hypothetical protein SAMN04487968_112112 [Nocardioides terrae]|uniref:Uncharacterized protein n=1 Tax=Nocardioides terrae TaxID=574651 RepID=A0A1I1MHV7_9ACTN|nr:hypothetical protein [Nocardioides terrae]SFC85007.1 hypothetical protein SAMN04487968_112112 [Nocardioides terrae]